ncbi:MAG TPA: multidrug effflux MFS transporter [Bacteroidota bacterium]|nr:multidrug effflux MFS transporter [Bacteroidota bacterium]
MNKAEKLKLTLILGALTAIGPLSIDMYLPGFKSIANDFNTTMSVVGFSLTSYFIGYSFGQLLYGPLLDRFGRKIPLIGGLILYSISTLLCALSPNITSLIVSRFFLSIGGCSGVVASRAIVRDIFDLKESAKFFSSLTLVMGLAPIIAPLFGSLLTVYFGWRYIFIFLFFFTIILLLSILFLLHNVKGKNYQVALNANTIYNSYLKIFKNPTFIAYGLAGSVSYASLFAYISGSPFVYMKVFGLSELHYSWAFGINALGLIIGSQTNRYWLKRTDSKKVTTTSLIILVSIAIILFIGIALEIFPAILSMIFIFLFIFLLGIVNPNTMALALSPFESNAGSASALMGSIQMIVSAIISGFVSSGGSALSMVSGMLVCSLSGLFIVIIFSKKI